MKFVDIKNDIAFRKIFGNENKKEILISFLNAVLALPLGKRVLKIELRDPFQLPEIKGLKSTILDVSVTDERGINYLVEMQVEEPNGFDKRVQYYTAKQYASQIEIGEDYPNLNQVIFIGILNFNFFEGEDYLTKHLIVNQKSGKQELFDLEFNFIELPKFKKEEFEIESLIDKWIYFLKKAPNLEIIPSNINDVGLQHAYEDAAQYNWTKRELLAYDYASMRRADVKGALELAVKRATEKATEIATEKAMKEGLEKGIEEGMEKGMEEGIEKGKKEAIQRSILNLHKNGVPLETIADSLEITYEEVVKTLEKNGKE